MCFAPFLVIILHFFRRKKQGADPFQVEPILIWYEICDTLTEKEVLFAPLEVIVYCDWTEEQKEPWKQIPEINLKFAPLVNGYFR